MAQFTDANLQSQYNSILSQMQGSGAYTPLSMPEQTLDSITEQLVQTLRPQYERAIANRYGATKQQKAAIDVDAASRGMGTSTWVTDAKNRLMANETADIAGLESDYAAQLAGDALNQYKNYLSNKLQLEQYNQQLQAALEGEAYDRAMSQYAQGMVEGTLPYQQLMFNWEQTQNATKGSGGGSKAQTQTGFFDGSRWWNSEEEYLASLEESDEAKQAQSDAIKSVLLPKKDQLINFSQMAGRIGRMR